jgi:glycosyltransferase involved in cell wall biosynthesis
MLICNVDEEGRFGGPENRIINVASSLEKIGVDTLVIMPIMDSDTFQRHAKYMNVNYRCVDITRLSLEKRVLIRYATRFFVELIELIKVFRKSKCDVVHVNGAYQFKSALAAWLARKAVVWHLNNQTAHPVVRFAFEIVFRIIAPSCIVASQRAEEYFLKNKSNVNVLTTIHAPVDGKRFTPKNKYNITGLPQVGSVTNLSRQKDPLTFLRVAAAVRKQCPNVVFSIAGPILSSHSDYYSEFQSLMKELEIDSCVKLLGFVDDIPDFHSTLDIFVCTSAWEGSPTAVWEALASGLPVVTTDVGSTNKYVGQYESGIVCAVGDVDGLASAIIKLLNGGDEDRASLGVKARETAERHLSVKKAAQLHKQHYERAFFV